MKRDFTPLKYNYLLLIAITQFYILPDNFITSLESCLHICIFVYLLFYMIINYKPLYDNWQFRYSIITYVIIHKCLLDMIDNLYVLDYYFSKPLHVGPIWTLCWIILLLTIDGTYSGSSVMLSEITLAPLRESGVNWELLLLFLIVELTLFIICFYCVCVCSNRIDKCYWQQWQPSNTSIWYQKPQRC